MQRPPTKTDNSRLSSCGDEQIEPIVIPSPSSNTCEVMIGPYLGKPTISQLADTLLWDPNSVLAEVILRPVIHSQTSTPLPSPDTVSVGQKSTRYPASDQVISYTIELHRVSLVEEMISQF